MVQSEPPPPPSPGTNRGTNPSTNRALPTALRQHFDRLAEYLGVDETARDTDVAREALLDAARNITKLKPDELRDLTIQLRTKTPLVAKLICAAVAFSECELAQIEAAKAKKGQSGSQILSDGELRAIQGRLTRADRRRTRRR